MRQMNRIPKAPVIISFRQFSMPSWWPSSSKPSPLDITSSLPVNPQDAGQIQSTATNHLGQPALPTIPSGQDASSLSSKDSIDPLTSGTSAASHASHIDASTTTIEIPTVTTLDPYASLSDLIQHSGRPLAEILNSTEAIHAQAVVSDLNLIGLDHRWFSLPGWTADSLLGLHNLTGLPWYAYATLDVPVLR